MLRANGFRRVLVAIAATLSAVALSACDPTPVMLSGTVTFDDSGSPAGGTVVSVLTTGGQIVAKQTTGADGTFRFHESVLPAGEYLVAFGAALSEFWEDTTDDGSPTTVTVSAEEPTTIAASIAPSGIRGTITADGSPVAGAKVTVQPLGRDQVVATALTGADGTYELGVADDTFMVNVAAVGWQTTERIVFVGPNLTPTINVALDPEVSLTGVLYDGGAVHPATVLARTGSSKVIASAETRPDGSFAIGGLGTQPVGLTVIRGTSRVDLPGTYSGDAGLIVLSEATCTHPGAMAHADFSGQDLSGADLRGCDLNHANLTGADLTGALLSFTDLSSATLVNANLTDATLLGVNLTGSNLFGTTLQGTDLRQATLTHSSSGGIVGTPASLPHRWGLVQGALVGPGVNLPWAGFGGADLSNLDLTDADLTESDLTGANLSGTVLTGANLSGANLTNADLTGADLSGANLTGATFAGANMTDATVTNATLTANTNVTGATLTGLRSGGITTAPAGLPSTWILYMGHLAGPGANLTDANLPSLHMSPGSLTGANLTNANLRSANLTDVNLTEANLTNANLTNANLFGANLTNANLTNANLTGADLQANLTGADLTGATLTSVRSGRATGAPAVLPAPWAYRNGALLGPTAHVSWADLSSLDLSGLDLTGMTLYDNELTGADLTGTDLTDASLEAMDLTGVDLTGTTLTRITSLGLTGSPLSLPAPWALRGGRLVGPTANLHGAVLNHADLGGLDLTDATLTNADLSGANLFGANLDGAALGSADLTGANLVTATVTDADLTGANLSRAWLIDAVLTGANLSSTNLSGTWLGGAALDGTTSSGIVGTPADLPTGWTLSGGSLVHTG